MVNDADKIKSNEEVIEELKKDALYLLNEKTNKLLDYFGKIEKERNKILIEFDGEVKTWGHSAHVSVSKKYTGRKVRIQILKEEGDN